MVTLYSYPQLFGVPDNNPFGLKVDTFLRLTKIEYTLEHIINTANAPRGQLPYLLDDDKVVTESNSIIRHLTQKYNITLDDNLTETQRNLHFLITRMLDSHLYWVMSYSRWQDERFWPLFKAEFLSQSPQITEEILEKAKAYNIEKYHYQGIGRYTTEEVYQSGIDDLKTLSFYLGTNDFLFGKSIHTVDVCCYGFLANIFYFEIDTPLKAFIPRSSNLGNYIKRIRALLNY